MTLSRCARARAKREPLSYKWLAHAAGISTSDAQGVLQRYAASHAADGPGAVDAQYIVCGARALDSGAGVRTVRDVRLVRADQLAGAKAALSEVTAVHVYSIHLRGAADTAVGVGHALWSADARQAKELLRSEAADARAFQNNTRSSIASGGVTIALPGHRMSGGVSRSASGGGGGAANGASESGGGPQLATGAPASVMLAVSNKSKPKSAADFFAAPAKGKAAASASSAEASTGAAAAKPAKKQAPERPGTLNAFFGAGRKPATSAAPAAPAASAADAGESAAPGSCDDAAAQPAPGGAARRPRRVIDDDDDDTPDLPAAPVDPNAVEADDASAPVEAQATVPEEAAPEGARARDAAECETSVQAGAEGTPHEVEKMDDRADEDGGAIEPARPGEPVAAAEDEQEPVSGAMDQFVDAAAAAEAAAPKKKTKKKLIQKTYQDEKGYLVTANVRLSRRFLSLSLSLSPPPTPPARPRPEARARSEARI